MNWLGVMVVMAAVAVTAFSGYLLANWPPDPPAPATRKPASAPATTGPAQEDPVMVVLGDSVSAESRASAGPEWPELVGDSLGFEVVTETVDGSGYVAPGEGLPFGGRVQDVLDHDADLIVVAGGISDLGAFPVPDVVRAAEGVVTELAAEAPDAEIVVVSPFSNDEPGPLTMQFSARLQQIASENDAQYVDATRWLTDGYNLFAGDGVHPTDDGQKRIAEQMEQELDGLL